MPGIEVDLRHSQKDMIMRRFAEDAVAQMVLKVS
jgi:hypothetical protein